MKNSFLILALFISTLTFGANPPKKGTVTVNTKYEGIIEGYDGDLYLDRLFQ